VVVFAGGAVVVVPPPEQATRAREATRTINSIKQLLLIVFFIFSPLKLSLNVQDFVILNPYIVLL